MKTKKVPNVYIRGRDAMINLASRPVTVTTSMPFTLSSPGGALVTAITGVARVTPPRVNADGYTAFCGITVSIGA